jgi:spermidine synthase
MTSLTRPTIDQDSRLGFLPWLLPLFAVSGCSALIYEIVWFQLLQLVIGSSAVSLCVLLGTFMGGMCVGSVLLPQVIAPHRHPLRVYALVEFLLGIIGLAVLFGMPALDRAYDGMAASGLTGIFQRAVLAAVCLLLPTILMGATLPILARFVELTPRGVSWLGFLYGVNIAGAVAGCLLAGFYLLRMHNMAVATYWAAALNGAVAFVSLVLSFFAPHEAPAISTPEPSAPAYGSKSVYVAIALSGTAALAAEVVWTRLLALLLGATVYTFSIILAVFLIGLAIGGAIGSLLARIVARPAVALGWCQLLLTCAIAWSAYELVQHGRIGIP